MLAAPAAAPAVAPACGGAGPTIGANACGGACGCSDAGDRGRTLRCVLGIGDHEDPELVGEVSFEPPVLNPSLSEMHRLCPGEADAPNVGLGALSSSDLRLSCSLFAQPACCMSNKDGRRLRLDAASRLSISPILCRMTSMRDMCFLCGASSRGAGPSPTPPELMRTSCSCIAKGGHGDCAGDCAGDGADNGTGDGTGDCTGDCADNRPGCCCCVCCWFCSSRRRWARARIFARICSRKCCRPCCCCSIVDSPPAHARTPVPGSGADRGPCLPAACARAAPPSPATVPRLAPGCGCLTATRAESATAHGNRQANARGAKGHATAGASRQPPAACRC